MLLLYLGAWPAPLETSDCYRLTIQDDVGTPGGGLRGTRVFDASRLHSPLTLLTIVSATFSACATNPPQLRPAPAAEGEMETDVEASTASRARIRVRPLARRHQATRGSDRTDGRHRNRKYDAVSHGARQARSADLQLVHLRSASQEDFSRRSSTLAYVER